MNYSGWGLGVYLRPPLPPFTIETFINKILGYLPRSEMSATKHCKRCDRDLPLSFGLVIVAFKEIIEEYKKSRITHAKRTEEEQ